jgi:hypothetical protein
MIQVKYSSSEIHWFRHLLHEWHIHAGKRAGKARQASEVSCVCARDLLTAVVGTWAGACVYSRIIAERVDGRETTEAGVCMQKALTAWRAITAYMVGALCMCVCIMH